ncbi:hypothetical protein [Paraflavitalea speifideaquila]|uniref:hypothetical protein n=1 Tax=Paraflavitalea speifideaquila TaxID=3076558 RepID=UPI0028F02456|nr:hypothetical protein [Paraflavitalea speifideiaquila]
MRANFIVLILSLVCSVSMAQTITEVYFPKYIQGVGSFNFEDERRVPFACRMTVSGLTPNTTYRYYNRFVYDPTDPLTQGEGNYILVKDSGNFVRSAVPSLATPGSYGEFTTNATGSYTGWFITEPNVAAVFETTGIIYFRLILNDGIGGAFIAHRLTAPSPVTVINFGTDAISGTGLRATPLNKGAAKQFVFLYDNFEASGRPVAGTFMESDGTANTLANGYAPFMPTV